MHFLQKALNCAGRDTHMCSVLLSHMPKNLNLTQTGHGLTWFVCRIYFLHLLSGH